MAEVPAPASAAEHEARAMEMMVKIRELVRSFDGFTFAGKGRRVQIAQFNSVSDEVFELMALAAESNPDVAASWPVTAAELRAAIVISRAYRSVFIEMQTQARGVDDTVAEFRGDIGRRVLNAYGIAKRQNKQEPRQTLIPHLDAVQRALNRGRKKLDEATKAVRAAARKAPPQAPPQVEVKP
jgi:hypothetical protein